MSSPEIEALYRREFPYFVRFAFRELRPRDLFQENWHIDLIVDRLQPILSGEPKRLVVNMPPRHLKTLICSLALPAFVAGNNPTKQIMLIVGSNELAQQFMEKLKKLMGGKRYRALFPHLRMTWTSKLVSFSHGGSIKINVVGNSLSGRDADLIIVDDPISPSYAKDQAKRQATNSWYQTEVTSRPNHDKAASVLLVMQRVHSDDLSGYVLRNDPSFERLILPAVAVGHERWELQDGRVFIREHGDLLHPERFDVNAVLRALDRMNGVPFSWQYLQGAYLPRVIEGTEARYVNVWEPRPEGWKAPDPMPFQFLHFKMDSKEFVLRDVFREEPIVPKPAHEMPITPEEFFICAADQQHRLLATVQLGSKLDRPAAKPNGRGYNSTFSRRARAIFKAAHENRYARPTASS